MSKRRPEAGPSVRWRALEDAEDRQRALSEVCRAALKDFVGRELTPTLLLQAEAEMRAALDEAVRAGKYVLPDGLRLSRVELGADMRIKVYFDRVSDHTKRFVAVGNKIDEPEKEDT